MPATLSLVDYFSVALPNILRQRAQHATAAGVNIRFVVTGRGGGTWTLRLRPPSACVVQGAEWKADLIVSITVPQMRHMLAGTFDARRAIARGDIDLRGDVSLLKHVAFLLQAQNPAGQTAQAL
ncbi:MAG: hypothetical protein EOO40_03350 [Deltaproteobacteria bacterium]|nr:MAG: hypothetical protein EOO40_03350 [Deltaproteobacteria bacterium]